MQYIWATTPKSSTPLGPAVAGSVLLPLGTRVGDTMPLEVFDPGFLDIKTAEIGRSIV